MFIFDVEIKHGIPPKDAAERKDDLIYCASWTDYAAMGVACVCVWDYTTNNPRVFGEQEMEELQKFIDSHDVAIGFNNNRFDNNVLQAAGVVIQPSKSYDLLIKIFDALGSYQKGCQLDDVVKANFPGAVGKTGDGAFAPELWQKGFYTRVIDYCFNDVRMTKMLIDKILRCGFIKNPIFPEQTLRLKRP